MKKQLFSSTFSLAIGTLLLTVLLASCTGKDVTVDITSSDTGASLPVVTGLSKSEQINTKLAELFEPYAEQAQRTVEASDGRLQVVYDIFEAENYSFFHREYTLDMGISDGKDTMKIVSLSLNGPDRISMDKPGDLAWLDSADLTECALMLKRAGLEADLSDLDSTADEEFAVNTFVGLYEGLTGEALDISDVKVGSAVGENFQKALKLGLLTTYGTYDGYDYLNQIYAYNVLGMACTVMDQVEHDVYGRRSQFVTGQEFADMIRTVHRICQVQESEDSDYRWSDLGEVDFSAVAAKISDDPAYLFTRRDGAQMVCKITNEGPTYSHGYSNNGLFLVEDSDSIWVRYAVTYNFMEYYGDSVLFAPDAGFTVTNAIKSAKCYIISRYNDWSYATNYDWDGIYSKKDVIIAAGRTAEYFDNRPTEDKYNFEKKVVINDRDYDWFFSQKNTGTSSSVNCMPSIATMAAHWYDETSTVTVQDMRATSQTNQGWDMELLRNGLKVYHIPYETGYANFDNILAAIDEGKIVLVQYSDRPFNMTGHCYVIYGYQKYGDSVTFIINDSESMLYRGEIFGRANGNGDEVEGQFALWSIQRFYSGTTIVG